MNIKGLFRVEVCALTIAALGLAACGNYRVVRRTPNGGEVALEGDQGKAREKAEEYMRGQCPSGYDVLEEGEAVVGQEMTGNTHEQKVFGLPVQTTSASTQDKREWRVKYQCKGTTPTPAANGAVKPSAQIQQVIVRY